MSDKKVLLFGIPFIALLMFVTFGGWQYLARLNEGLIVLFYNVTNTVLIWLGVRQIVITLWDRFPWEIHPLKHLIWEIVLVTGYTFLVGLFSYIAVHSTQLFPMDAGSKVGVSILVTMLVTYLITSLHEAWFFYTQWNVSLVKAKALEKENLQSQYETLKSQINPHFLFNTLNTLTNLIEENKDVAVVYVGKTADFLRTILNTKDKEVITLKEEVRLIETFYFLQKERYGDNLQLQIQLPENVLKTQIPPLALQMLVENSIKHNIISAAKPLLVEIFVDNNQHIVVRNNLQIKNAQSISEGIGLQNIRNRYVYLSSKAIDIEQNEAFFEVKLPLLDG